MCFSCAHTQTHKYAHLTIITIICVVLVVGGGKNYVCVISWSYMGLDMKGADDVCLASTIKGVYYSPGGFSPCVCLCMYVCVPCEHKIKCTRCICHNGPKHYGSILTR